ncbi:unnamed protein product [Wickerhamomyces anomalus]
MPRDPLIGIVGKPSSGKSTTLTDAAVKTGAFPFTTIDPNKATGYLKVDCACSRFGKEALCKPNYGWCSNGSRHIPILLLDVAGLVPGAHMGRGIGNKFLDDLRQADALIHVVDVSGSTDAEGKATLGYDPLADVEWLQDEIRLWIEGNLEKRWGSYSANGQMIARAMDRVPDVGKLEDWNKEDITRVVKAFMDEKFPTVLSLNKIDHPDSDKNVSKILLKYPKTKAVLTSAITEVFLRKLSKQGFIKYEEGTEFIDTREDLPDDESLKPMDEKLLNRVENIRDLVLYRFGSTGVVQVLQAATEVLGLVPIYTVRNISNFTGSNGTNVFRDCTLIRKGTPVSKVARHIMGEVTIAAIEGVGGVRVSEDDTIDVGKNDILSFRVVPGGGGN